MIYQNFVDKFESTIKISDIKNKNVIMASYFDTALYWVHTLASDTKYAHSNEDWLIYYSEKFDVYFMYYLRDSNISNFSNAFDNITKDNNIHFILSDGRFTNELTKFFEANDIENFKYSLLNFNSEVLYDSEPHPLNQYKKMKYFFSCTNVIGRTESGQNVFSNWTNENSERFIMDYKYAFMCFYHKLGFNYFQKGEQHIEISNRLDKVFLYSKSPKVEGHPRWEIIKMAMETGKLYDKKYSENDWFWYYANYNYYHTPFVVDYNMCKLNLVIETQNPLRFSSPEAESTMNKFFSEKTLKALMVSTPAYVLLQYDVYNELKEYGFYFLNEEFGSYVDFTNYERFCEFLKGATESDIDSLFTKAYEYSKHNKKKVEEYIYSDKVKELELLIG